MRQKELRIALVCYGGISLAVYMHGVTKELWKVLRASRASWSGGNPGGGVEQVYNRLFETLRDEHGLRLRVMTDIVAGASAGGINSVFLAQAIHSGESLEPLTELWLSKADVDVLLDPDARPVSRAAKFWATPLVSYLLNRPGNEVSRSVAPETAAEVREKLSRLIRSRWFEPPFSGIGFSRLIFEALEAMAASPEGPPLLPPGHPLDLFATATDFSGQLQPLYLHSPPLVLESEHRLTIGFRAHVPPEAGRRLAPPFELVLAARATASFPGAFPPLMLAEIDRLAEETGKGWPTRTSFLKRTMPEHVRVGDVDAIALIDGSVLVNAPFGDAISVLRERPAHRELDRRFVYIDPVPADTDPDRSSRAEAPGFFTTIFGSLSAIPREQPIRDNLEALEKRSRETATLRAVIDAVRPEVEDAVEKLFGRTLFFDRPTPKRLANWRAKSQQAAWEQAGFAYHGYSQLKYMAIVESMGREVAQAFASDSDLSWQTIVARLHAYFAGRGLDRMSSLRGGASSEAITFFRSFDIDFRVRRLRLLARQVTHEREDDDEADEAMRDHTRDVIFDALSLYIDRQSTAVLGDDFALLARDVMTDTGAVTARIAERRALAEADGQVDAMLSDVLGELPASFRRRLLLGYLGFPFYDTVTMPLLRGDTMNEFNPVKVDRISPDDCSAIRSGGAKATLRGIEFHNFGAFFSRAYRENDYLWGRLHGAERMIDLITSMLDDAEGPEHDRAFDRFRHDAFLAILDEEEDRLTADPALIGAIREEVLAMRR
ncbi:patatin [Novosphingobium sp. PC22D]|uniref:patatin-like protein n=1 Tax=Novosphingobium sp. PC22D TaxID=1962403 RepID=UPI000BF20AEB|nr:patatin-like protein [Novosphingobium sp. PC22D]PEQ11287.1 patatin [Novosphingobium sp. PC22D]